MTYKEITFGQGRGYLIQDPALITHINNNIINRARINLGNGNKFFKTFEEQDVSTMKQIPHKVTFNLKGKQTAGFLYLFKYQFRPYCVYIREKEQRDNNNQRDNNKDPRDPRDKNEKVFEYVIVKHRFNESLYQGTLFHGNFLQINQYQNIFLIHDLLIWRDHAHLNELPEKIKILTEVFNEKFTADPALDTYQLLLKEYCDYDQIKDFVTTYRHTLPYQSFINGVIFRPFIRNQRYIVLILNRFDQQTDQINKVASNLAIKQKSQSREEKELSDQTIAIPTTNKSVKPAKPVINHVKYPKVLFKMRKTAKPDVYELYLADSSSEKDVSIKYGIAVVPTLKESQAIRTWFTNSSDEIKIEAEYQITFHKWRPIQRVSDDATILSLKALES